MEVLHVELWVALLREAALGDTGHCHSVPRPWTRRAGSDSLEQAILPYVPPAWLSVCPKAFLPFWETWTSFKVTDR